MSFNPDPSKKASLTFDNTDVGQIRSQKYLGMFLDFKLSSNERLDTGFAKVNRGITILRKLQTMLPIEALLTIYKSFTRPHFDYGDVIQDQLYNDSFHAKLESYHYKSVSAMT